MIELDLNSEYLAELYNEKGGITSFKNLTRIPKIPFFEEGLELIIKLLEQKFDFKSFIIEALINSKDKESFKIYKEMLFASFENIYHIPFVFENKPCLFQLRKKQKYAELFLYFNVFGGLKLLMQDDKKSLHTPFNKVGEFLSSHSDIELIYDKNVKAFFEFQKLLDFKG